jgi:phosphate transport system protein
MAEMIQSGLAALRKLLIEESMLVERMMETSVQGLVLKRSDLLTEVEVMERQLDRMEVALEQECLTLLALHHPEAKNLRTTMMTYTICHDLERMGDLTYTVSRSFGFFLKRPYFKPLVDLATMAKETRVMMKDAMTSFINEDAPLARQVLQRQQRVQKLCNTVFNRMLQDMSISAENAYHINRISQSYERIAALSANIAENTIFMVLGTIIKHSGAQSPETELHMQG